MEISSFMKFLAVFELMYSVIIPVVIVGTELWSLIEKEFVFENGYHYGWFISVLGCAGVHFHSSFKFWKLIKLDNEKEMFIQAETVYQVSLYFPDMALLYLEFGPALIPVRKVVTGMLYVYLEELRSKIESPKITFLEHRPRF